VVVPVHGGDVLDELVGRVASVLGGVSARPWEVILVNDGSPESCWRRIEDLARRHANVRGIDLTRNYGQHNALLCGLRAAAYDTTVTMDDDLQHPPEEIPKLLPLREEGWDVVYGTPARQRQPFWRRVASMLVRIALAGAIGWKRARGVSAFRAVRTENRRAFADFRGPFVSLDVLLSWSTDRAAHVEVRHEARKSGASGYSFWRLASHAADMMTGFSAWPLRLASVVGFGFTLFGLAVLAYVIVRYVVAGGSVPGFPFLASIIAIFSGRAALRPRIIEEFLARMHFRSMGQPGHVVRQGRRRRDRPRTGLDRDPDEALRSGGSGQPARRPISSTAAAAWFENAGDRRAEYWLDEIRSALLGPRARGARGARRRQGRRGPGCNRRPGLGDASARPAHHGNPVSRRRRRVFERASILERLLDGAARRSRGSRRGVSRPQELRGRRSRHPRLERRGFLLMVSSSTTADFPHKRASRSPRPPPDVRVRLATREDPGGPDRSLRRAFPAHSGRFHSDEEDSSLRRGSNLRRWIRSSVEGFADWVLAAECRGAVVGYSTWKKPSEIERDTGSRSDAVSIGRSSPSMPARALRALSPGRHAAVGGTRAIDRVPTHAANVPVQRAFTSLGWKVADARHGFHRWSKP
jgi:undecaprenyl-phosphate 4-deoxy-4-formamido-L-arabinose transferase